MYRAPIMSTFISCDKYAPIELASASLPPLTLPSDPSVVVTPQMLIYPLSTPPTHELFIGIGMGADKTVQIHPLHPTELDTHHSTPHNSQHLVVPQHGTLTTQQ